MAAQLLVEKGHSAVVHARSEQRGKEALSSVPGAEDVVIGDLMTFAETRSIVDDSRASSVRPVFLSYAAS